jgi:phosphoglycolate phosphatase-like HAD superfamily hydrolase
MIDDMLAARTAIFDCDGVILKSNRLKSEAFAKVLEDYDPDLVGEFIAWHKSTGGVSRFQKFAYYFRDMLKAPEWQALSDAACIAFGKIVSRELRSCPTIPGFTTLVEYFGARKIPMAVNTGGAQAEIRSVFSDRGFAHNFREILGSPTTKQKNMEILKSKGLILPGSVYFGDSELDFCLAQEFSLDFVYVSYESEWTDGAEVTREAMGTVVNELTELFR